MSFFNLDQLHSFASSPNALLILSLFSFSESAFFIIPPEVLLLPLALAQPTSALWFAAITTITSVFGAILGYVIGVKGGRPILKRLFSEEKISKVKLLYIKYDAWALIIAAFTPIPFKVFTIAAGVFDIQMKRLIIASVIGRGSRYFLLAGLIFIFGDSIRYFLEHQLDQFILILTLVIVGGAFFYKIIWPKIEARLYPITFKEKVVNWLRLIKR